MLAILAAVALAVGATGVAVTIASDHEAAAAKTPTPVVEVQPIQSATTPSE
jgi:flagellar basal body-associated protein FliL